MRGKRWERFLAEITEGITPADAGKTVSAWSKVDNNLGSPPRMRGKHVTQIFQETIGRITPADAGKTNGLI